MGAQARKMTKYLLWFAQEHVNFRATDVESVASIFGINVKYGSQISDSPYCVVELAEEREAHLLASRCISLKSVIELWGHGASKTELHQSVKSLSPSFIKPHIESNKSFKVVVETFCKTLSMAEKVERIETFSYLPFQGDVNLKSPDVTYYLLEYFGQDSNSIPEEPYELFFGRLVAEGQRSLITKLSLKTRHFLGNTSMDAQLSLLMANQAKVVPGSIVFDPFVGSGSLLVAAAQFGGYVLGSDIDFLMLHGKSRPVRPNQKKRKEGECIEGNMRQYGLLSKYVDVLVADFSRPLWKPDVKFDVIITDPPYGVREAITKVGSWLGPEVKPIEERHLPHHVPAKVAYCLPHLMADLLKFAALHLVVGGRLVFWLPIVRDEYDENQSLPRHKSLRLLSNCEQVLSCHSSRLLLCYEKVEAPDCEDGGDCPLISYNTSFRDRHFPPAMGVDPT